MHDLGVWQDVAMKVIIKEKCKNESQLVLSISVCFVELNPVASLHSMIPHTGREAYSATQGWYVREERGGLW